MISVPTSSAYCTCLQIDIFVQVLQADGGKQIVGVVPWLYLLQEALYYLFWNEPFSSRYCYITQSCYGILLLSLLEII